jgi:hypothetical protein
MGLTDILSTFKGFFTRTFWFGSFLPIAIFAGIHLLVASWLGTGIDLASLISADSNKLIGVPLAMFALVVVAYAATPLIPLVHGLLDATLLPQWLHDWLRREHLVEARAARRLVDGATAQFDQMGELNARLSASLQVARNTGNEHGALPAAGVLGRVGKKIDAMCRRFDRGWPPAAEKLTEAAHELDPILRANRTRLPANATDAQRAAAAQLSSAQTKLMELLKDAESNAAHELQGLLARNSRIAYDNPQATRMADIRLLSEQYCSKAYGVDFDYIWSRLQFVVPAQSGSGNTDSLSDRLATARAQVDFSILSIALSLTVPLVWLPYLAWAGESPVKYLVIAAAAPLLVCLFYFVALESRTAFGDVAMAAADMHRFALLSGLHLAMPASLADEREVWGDLQRIELIRDLNVIYKHPPK